MTKSKIVLVVLIFLFSSRPTFSLEPEEQEISDLEPSVVAICHCKPSTKTILGAGFIVTSAGMVVTADHVVTDDQGRVFNKLFALRPNYPEVKHFQLSVVKRFRKGLKGRDIAILKIVSDTTLSNLPYMSVGEKIDIGDPVLVVGFPLVFNKVYSWPLFRSGIIASTRYKYENSSILIIDLGSVKGYSGSPVISIKTKEVVGVFKGHPKKQPQTDFAIATVLLQNDIKPFK